MRWSVLTTKALICLFGHKGALAAWCVPGTRLPADHQPLHGDRTQEAQEAKFALALGSQGNGLLLFDHLVGARSSPANCVVSMHTPTFSMMSQMRSKLSCSLMSMHMSNMSLPTRDASKQQLRFNLRLIAQNHVQQGTVDFNMAVVINKAQLPS